MEAMGWSMEVMEKMIWIRRAPMEVYHKIILSPWQLENKRAVIRVVMQQKLKSLRERYKLRFHRK